jgi:hypothetical protein
VESYNNVLIKKLGFSAMILMICTSQVLIYKLDPHPKLRFLPDPVTNKKFGINNTGFDTSFGSCFGYI